jgi:hypothetical protein
MILILSIAAAAAILAALISASIKIRVRLVESQKTIAVKYTLFQMNLDLQKKTGHVRIAGIEVFRFELAFERKLKEKAKKPRKELPPVGKERKKFYLTDLKVEYLIRAKSLVGNIRIKELMIKLTGGWLEPFYTGKMFAYYCAAKGMYPSLMSHVEFRPDFSSEKMKIEGKGLVCLRMYHILRLIFGLLADKLKEKSHELFKIRRRVTIYG